MHPANRQWWRACENRYPAYFKNPSKVIEFGSALVGGGSVRDHFQCDDYTGIDWRPQRGVDIVSLAHEAPFNKPAFDTVVSSSMLEHDPFWEASITKMVQVLKNTGILFLSWGAAHNFSHCLKEAPDGLFHSLPAGRALHLLEKLGIYIHDFRYECHITDDFSPPEYRPGYEEVLRDYRDIETGIYRGPNHKCGEVVLVGFKDESLAPGTQFIDEIVDGDQ